MDWQYAGLAIGLIVQTAGVSYWLGRQAERLSNLRKDHDQLHEYAHRINHDTIRGISEAIHEIQLMLVRVLPPDQWPRKIE